MKRLKLALLMGLGIILSQGCVIQNGGGGYQGGYWEPCGRGHKLRLVDLDMSPDPAAAGQRIDRFRVSVNSDATGECATQLSIHDQSNDVIATERVYRLRPGLNQIRIDPDARYRFSRQEVCFNVYANIENTPQVIDAARRFCARQIGGNRWTLNP
jgi:hypothetical protein